MGEHKQKRSLAGGRPATKRSRPLITAVIVVAVAGSVIAIDMWQNNNTSPFDDFIPERSKGVEAAPVKIVEFIDFQCSHCKEGAGVLKELMALHQDKIRLTMKYYPLGQLNSSMSAYYAECAARQGKFWAMHDALLETQDEWRSIIRVKPLFDRLATEAGLDQAALDACVESNKTKKTVAKDRALGDSYQVRSTPSYFLNGEMVVGVHSLKKKLDDLIGE